MGGGSCFTRWFRNSSQAVMPSSCGMFVYSQETLRVTKRQMEGNQGNLRNLFIKSMVSQICDGSCMTLGRRKKSAKREMFYVGAPFEATMGQPGFPGVYIFGITGAAPPLFHWGGKLVIIIY